ncbi:DUF3097 domain-containing protein [Frigoribacterium sp. CG_9.8]|uniref:DUF3097 domain-containing protein n=1 Tax=Frigoribacterium sp. CG_9.8 TaxID=2787733 RepID=UPI0018C9C309|nr:DUF3097 domain-containing protein [Frigoribacterium sp. CG_9.8]MBG6107126.1 hypothetical protein [Frigoribacterium sp. CG_9.8]
MSFGEYGEDPLAGDWRGVKRKAIREVAAERDLVIEWAETGFCGAVLRVENKLVHLEDYRGGVRLFPLGGGFLLEGEPVMLTAPVAAAKSTARTASGSLAVADQRARVALPSRIFVEGRHDAELVEKVWGADLRIEGVVVEYLEGIDDLDAIVREFAPGPGRRIGVLVDHLVDRSKESRIADAVARGPFGAHVLVVGHPFVDIWQAVKPARLGLNAWPDIPRSIEWKKGICESLGWPHEDQADIAAAWQRILGRVRTYADLEPVVLGRVEQLIDFVTG